ncbi:hypothetical protein D3C86_1961020 [compost metagenome]
MDILFISEISKPSSFSFSIDANSYILLKAILASFIGIEINARLAIEGSRVLTIPKTAINSPILISLLKT